MAINYRNKAARIGWHGIADGFESYANAAAVTAVYTKVDAGAIGTLTLDTSTVAEGAQSLKIAVVAAGPAQVLTLTRAVAGLKASTTYMLRGRIQISAAGVGTGGIISIEGGGGAAQAFNSAVGIWQNVVCEAVSDASGGINVVIALRNLPAGTFNVYFDDLRLELDLLLGIWLDEAVSYPECRDGSEFAQAPSGVEDAWITGTDYLLSGIARWIPAEDVISPAPATGWNGVAGWEQFLVNGWARNIARFYPDPAGAFYVPFYLVEPLQRTFVPALEDNSQRKVPLILRSSNQTPFPGF